ncbi:MAG TPA: phosphatidylglycerophosphatase A [candidate division Zixibacteria bacterium]
MGAGYLPPFPGTWGSLLTLILVWFFISENFYLLGGITLIVFIISLWSATEVERFFGEDDRRIVIDESCGMLISFLFLPKRPFLYILAFVIFRLLDIIKPPPANACQKLKGGLGVTLDDVVAGIYTNIIMHVLIYARILKL